MTVYEIEFKHTHTDTHQSDYEQFITVTKTKGCRKVETKNSIKSV